MSPAATERSKQVESLLDKLRRQHGEAAGRLALPDCGWCGEDRVLCALVGSFMLWEASIARATAAVNALTTELIDANELRVSLPEELHAIIGRNYPRGLERVTRLRAALNDVYRREHAVKLSHLTDRPKREARAYLESLTETPLFVAARTLLVGLEGHAVPIDERLLGRLIEADAVGDESATPESTSASLERVITAPKAAEAHALMLAWAEESTTKPKTTAARKSRTRVASGGGGSSGGAVVASAAKRSPARRTAAGNSKHKPPPGGTGASPRKGR